MGGKETEAMNAGTSVITQTMEERDRKANGRMGSRGLAFWGYGSFEQMEILPMEDSHLRREEVK